MSVELRPLVLDDMGVGVALENYVERFMGQYDISVEIYIQGLENRRLPSYVETSLFRIVQEAMINIVRHAAASSITIIIELIENEIRGVIEDNGKGFNVAEISYSKRLGIYGMQERALLLGGSLALESEPGQGIMVYFNIPVETSIEKGKEKRVG